MAHSVERVFIVGMPRSGTKLLRNMLGRHSLVSVLDIETEFLPMLVEAVGRRGDLSDRKKFQEFFKWISVFPYFVFRQETGATVDANAWYDACEDFSPAGIFDAFMRVETGVVAGGVWVDKSPSYIGHIPLLKELFPDARIVLIARDVRDYCLSMRKAWGKSMMRAAQRWRDDMIGALAVAETMPKDVLLVRYEDLLAKPEKSMRRIAVFLDIEFEPDMRDPGRVTENLGNAKGRQGLVRDNTGSFSSLMDTQTVARIEAIAGPAMDKLGYARWAAPAAAAFGELSRVELLALKIYDAFQLFRFEIRERGLVNGILFQIRYALSSGNRYR